jgi:hypothetical protein
MIRSAVEFMLENPGLYAAHMASLEQRQQELAAFLEALAMNQAPEVPAL